MVKPGLVLKGIKKSYEQGGRHLDILNGTNLNVQYGTITALVGQSGSGKSTLLHIAGLLDRAEEGEIFIGGNEVSKLNDAARTKVRLSDLGFVYQFHHLMPDFTAIENAEMPLKIAGVDKDEARDRAERLLGKLGLEDRLHHVPGELSGGEQQRVAIARSLIHKPKVLLADEPTGNLDAETSELVMQALLDLVHETGIAAVIATHDMTLAMKMDNVLKLKEGELNSYIAFGGGMTL